MVAPVTSYDTLVAAVMSLAEDTGTELLDYLPVAIDNAEQRLTKEIDIQGMTYVSSAIPLSVGSYTVTKPSGHKLTYFIKTVDSSGNQTLLVNKTEDYLTELWPSLALTGTPRYYCDVDETTFKVIPPTNASVSVFVKGVKRPTALSTSNQTNVFTRQASAALLYATMVEVATWQRNDAMLAKYAQMYVDARDSLNNEGRRQRRDSLESPDNPSPPANTLLGGN